MKKSLLLMLGVGVAIAGVVWFSFMRDRTPTALLQTEEIGAVNAIDSDVVPVLLQLRAVSLSGTIFTDPAFVQLRDFGSQITPEPVGRPNPFAPVQSATSTGTAPRTR